MGGKRAGVLREVVSPSEGLAFHLHDPTPSLSMLCFCLLQNGALAWSDDADGGRGREISRDFAKVCNVLS